jgi:hypothetical protein
MRAKEFIIEGGGYIPDNEKEAHDPRWEMAMTCDIRPGQDRKEAAKFGAKIGKKGPPVLRTNGLKESVYQKIPADLDLGDGFHLIYEPHPMEYDSNNWHLMKDGNKLGELTVSFFDKLPAPSVQRIFFDVKGYGGKAVKALVNFYGGLTSDPCGVTTDAAVRMWERLGAEAIADPKRVRGYYFQLLK